MPPRARDLGIPFGGTPGRWNAITDVPGVEVGYTTLIEGDAVRTGVTAIHPRGRVGAGDPVAAGYFSRNGNGEMTGVSWIEESGTFNGPIGISNTHAVGVVHAAIVAWTVRHHPGVAEFWLLPVSAETWDGYLNDIPGPAVVTAAYSAPASAGLGAITERIWPGIATWRPCRESIWATPAVRLAVAHVRSASSRGDGRG